MQGDVEGVLDGRLVAVGAHAGGDGVGRAEERKNLVDQMRAEVEEHSVGRVFRLLPCVLARDGPEAVEVRLEGDQAADGAFLQQLADGLKVAVPAAVVEGNGQQALALGELAEFLSLLAGGGEGLVDDDVLAGFERLLGQAKWVSLGVETTTSSMDLSAKELFERALDLGCGIRLGRLVALALHDGDQPQPWYRVDERRMKDAPAQPKPDDSNANLPALPFTSSQFLSMQDKPAGTWRRPRPWPPHFSAAIVSATLTVAAHAASTLGHAPTPTPASSAAPKAPPSSAASSSTGWP